MHEAARTANVVGYETLNESFAVTFPRRELEALRDAGDPAELWLELERVEDRSPKRLSIELTSSDIEELLQHPNGDDLLIALDGYALSGLFDDGDVEAHGLRSAIAIAVVAAGIAAPASVAANPLVSNVSASNPASKVQAVHPATHTLGSKAQVSKAQVSKPQVSKALVSKPQVSKAQVSKAQVSKAAQVSSVAARAQVSRVAVKAQVTLAGHQLKLLATGINRL